MKEKINDMILDWDVDQHLRICADGVLWETIPEQAYMEHDTEGRIYLKDASHKTLRKIDTGFSKGMLMELSDFRQSEIALALSVSVDITSNEVYCSLSTIKEDYQIHKINWPAPFTFEEKKDTHYTLLTVQQGILLPNTWENEVKRLPFHGQFCCADAYMPWFSQIKDGNGYIAIVRQPWDAGYDIDHPANGPYTHVGVYWLSSLHEMRYTRTISYQFVKQADHNTMCQIYKRYVKEIGHFTTLKEKAIRNPHVEDLIGCMFVHKGIKTHVSKNSDFFDPQNPDKNNSLTTFKKREEEVKEYAKKGVKQLYYHLDGWAQPGYDNQHPDYFPICEEAGGQEGLHHLLDTMNTYGYLLGLHDQYRDFYHEADSYHEEMAVWDAHQHMPSHKYWAGGVQSYLCSSIAPMFVKRNFEKLFQEGIYPHASYLDVFTCNEPDECYHPLHRVTRKESLAYREQCFAYLESKGILASSEEANDWAIEHLIFAHYGPYHSMMHAPDALTIGIDVPLFNLVYHECMILPWPMEKIKGHDDQMLFALLNGGAPYLEKDGAYPNTDGVFTEMYEQLTLDEKIRRSQIVCDLQKKVAHCAMINHSFLEGDYQVQTITYDNGIKVLINLHTQEYQIIEESSH